MIDDEKIKEAAKVVVEKKYAKDIPIIKDTFKNGFNTGINWFLDNLCHDMNKQVPNYYKDCLVELEIPDPKTGCYDVKAYVVAQYEGSIDVYSTPWYGEEINNLIVEERGRVTRWLYIDDLFPKKGGEE